MKVSALLEVLCGILRSEGDVNLAVTLIGKTEFEFLAERELTDAEWAWLAQDVTSNHVLDSRDVRVYMEVLAEASASGLVKSGEVR